MYVLFPRGRADIRAGFVCEVDDENNGVSRGYVAHRIRVKMEIIGFMFYIRFMHPGWSCVRATFAGYSRARPWESILDLGHWTGSF